jgi:hypothetical protein
MIHHELENGMPPFFGALKDPANVAVTASTESGSRSQQAGFVEAQPDVDLDMRIAKNLSLRR